MGVTKQKILVWESAAFVSGGQKMTLLVTDLLSDAYDWFYLIPERGALADELDARGIRYALTGKQSLPVGVKGKKAIPAYARMSSRALRIGVRAIKREKPCLIYAPGPAALPWSAICGSLTGLPVIWHLHHLFLDGPTKRLLDYCSGWKSVRKIVSVSQCVATQITNPKADAKKAVLYNPIDADRYANGESSVVFEECPELRKYVCDGVVITMIGILQEQKRQLMGIRLVRALADMGTNAALVLVGSPREGDSYGEVLRESVTKHGVDNRVFFLGQRGDIPDILALSDLVFIPSVEGFPLVGLEAMAAHVPILANAEGGAGEIVRQSGWGDSFDFQDEMGAVAQRALQLAKAQLDSDKADAFLEGVSNRRYKEWMKECFRNI